MPVWVGSFENIAWGKGRVRLGGGKIHQDPIKEELEGEAKQTEGLPAGQALPSPPPRIFHEAFQVMPMSSLSQHLPVSVERICMCWAVLTIAAGSTAVRFVCPAAAW